MFWRPLIAVGISILVMVSTIIMSGYFSIESKWDKIADPYAFNTVKWEFENILKKWEYLAEEILFPDEHTEEEKAELVKEYLSLSAEIGSIQYRVNRMKAEQDVGDREIESHEPEPWLGAKGVTPSGRSVHNAAPCTAVWPLGPAGDFPLLTHRHRFA